MLGGSGYTEAFLFTAGRSTSTLARLFSDTVTWHTPAGSWSCRAHQSSASYGAALCAIARSLAEFVWSQVSRGGSTNVSRGAVRAYASSAHPLLVRVKFSPHELVPSHAPCSLHWKCYMQHTMCNIKRASYSIRQPQSCFLGLCLGRCAHFGQQCVPFVQPAGRALLTCLLRRVQSRQSVSVQ
jgi:hypothetical protein